MKNRMITVLVAFTLAEILIVIGIIGVVAGLTIPNLIANSQKTEFVTGAKKAYSVTNQALKQMAADYGCIDDLKCTGLFDTGVADAQNTLGNALIKYFNVSKNCKTSTNQYCWTAKTNYNYDGTYSGSNPNLNALDGYKFITSDGMSFLVQNYSNNCLTDGTGGSTNWSNNQSGNMKQTCGFIYIDVNGLKKPNAFGRDTFEFFITNNKGITIYPRGGADDKWSDSNAWWKNALGKPRYCCPDYKWGPHCTGRVMEEGWQMNY